MTTDLRTIAIIEDNAPMRAALVRLLSAMGYSIEQYDSSEQFLANAARCRAACLIIDVYLPDASGLDLARHPAFLALERPFILSSASLDPRIRKQATAAGCCAFLTKPFGVNELLSALRVCWPVTRKRCT